MARRFRNALEYRRDVKRQLRRKSHEDQPRAINSPGELPDYQILGQTGWTARV
jgi:hypothetical protein